MKDNTLKLKDFRDAFRESQQQFPPKLTSIMEGVSFGQQKLVSERFKEREVLTGSVACAEVWSEVCRGKNALKYALKNEEYTEH